MNPDLNLHAGTDSVPPLPLRALQQIGENCRRVSGQIPIAVASCILGIAVTVAATDQSISPKISLETVAQLAKKWNSESNAQAKATIARQILDAGAPLVTGPMAPSTAKSVAEARKSASPLLADQKQYVSFWLVRAGAAVSADDEVAGVESANVLMELGMGQSDKPDEIKTMAALNAKGWLNAPSRVEKQKVIDAAKKGDMKTALAEADALVAKYPQNEPLKKVRNSIQDELNKKPTSAGPAAASPGSPKTNFTNSLGCKMIWIASLGIWVAETEVTQREFQSLMDRNPSDHLGDDLPVENVTAVEAGEFCHKLQEMDETAGLLPTQYGYALPTDEQWDAYCGNATLEDSVTSQSIARTGPQRVKSRQPNEYGLYDTRGNVWEWTRTPYDPSLNTPEIRDEFAFGVVESGPRQGKIKGLDPNGRVLRGGSWRSKGDLLKKSTRGSNDPGLRDNTNGFRVVLAPVE